MPGRAINRPTARGWSALREPPFDMGVRDFSQWGARYFAARP